MKKQLIAISVAGVLATVGIAACGPESASTPSKPSNSAAHPLGSKDATRDVQLGKMTTPYNTVEIPVTVTNHSSKISNYQIEATIYDAQGVQIDTAITYVQRLAPGGVARDSLLGMNGQQAETYKLSVVDRTASP